MSRIAKSPVAIPSGVEVSISDEAIVVKGPKGELTQASNSAVKIENNDGSLSFSPVEADSKNGWALAGTFRALLNNMVVGVTQGFEKKLTIIGVGYRAQAQGQNLNLSLGFSHPVVHAIPAGITVETPSQTEIVIKGSNKQLVGQVAAEVRAYRPPEPYKGKGVRYSDEYVLRKEAKKK